jgi:NADH-quinone oxidoreductase subunit N
MAASLLIELTQLGVSQKLFFDLIEVDQTSHWFNIMFYLVSIVTVLMIWTSDEMDRENDWESMGLVATLVLGMMFMASATDLLMVAVAIELVSIPSYLLVAMNKKDDLSKDAAVKYVLFGSFASGIMLYGMSMIFGLTGSTNFIEIWAGLAKPEVLGTPMFYFAILATMAGMMFKVAAVPFHFWCPDAYQAAPTPVTAFLSVAPKVAGLALIMRFVAETGAASSIMIQILSIISMATMTVGNLAALKQTDLKRLLAYSSISHAGFILMGVTVLTGEGRKFVFFYLIIYMMMNMAAFFAAMFLAKDSKYDLMWLRGAVKVQPVMVIGFTIALFSLAGIPPFAGFIGKFYLMKVALEAGLYVLVAVAGVNSVVSLYYYANVAKTMIIDDLEGEAQPKKGGFPTAYVIATAIPLVIFGLYWRPILYVADQLLAAM